MEIQEKLNLRESKKNFGIQTNLQLAKLLKWKSAKLLTLLGLNKSDHYSILSLRKRGSSTKFRTLHNPDNLMRVVQYKILTQILNKLEVPEYVHAFEKGKNIPKMAESHVGKAMIVSIDLEDFFTSIKQYHLFNLFQHFGFDEAPARTLSELCTYESFVPQGALTSPKLSNLITSLTFGPAIKKFCDDKGYTLTIYADDITISLDEKPREKSEEDIVAEILRTVSREVGRYRFRINRKKTKVMRPYQRQYVCGAVVNVKVNLQKSERNKLRAMVYNCNKNGIEAEAAKSKMTAELFYSKLMGRLNWFSQLNPTVGDRLKSKLRQADVSKHSSDSIAIEKT